jgi:hypothetical protein
MADANIKKNMPFFSSNRRTPMTRERHRGSFPTVLRRTYRAAGNSQQQEDARMEDHHTATLA